MTDENILFRKGNDRSIESTIAAGLLQVDTPELWTNVKFEPILLPSRVRVDMRGSFSRIVAACLPAVFGV